MLEHLEIIEGVCHFHLRGQCSLTEVMELIKSAIAHCRDRRIPKLLVNGRGLVGVPVPSLVDRFLMIEDWAQEAKSMVVVVLVVHEEYIHPEKFGVKVAAHFGLIADIYTSEKDALLWLSSGVHPT